MRNPPDSQNVVSLVASVLSLEVGWHSGCCRKTV